MERRAPRVGLLESHVIQKPEGGHEWVGMSYEAFLLNVRHHGARSAFQEARRFGDFGGMLTAELHAQAARGPLVARLHEEGFGEDEIDALIARHRRSHRSEAEWEEWEANRREIFAADSRGGT